MNTKPLDTLWQFANRVYHQADVQQACLQLQDDYDVDIPLLLFCCWVSRYRILMANEHIQQATNLAQQWRLHCIAPLRNIRRNMKSTDTVSKVDTDNSPWQVIREQVKASELAAEKCLLEDLEAITDISYNVHYSGSAPLIDIIFNHIGRCIGWQLLLSRPAMAAIATILCAAYPDLQYHVLIQSMEALVGPESND